LVTTEAKVNGYFFLGLAESEAMKDFSIRSEIDNFSSKTSFGKSIDNTFTSDMALCALPIDGISKRSLRACSELEEHFSPVNKININSLCYGTHTNKK
jgi:hypothetical protein